ncbi:SGNH/GDSL hydrolase family protein [Legionella sp. CNM-4043-24]|uniref:SGNH/GDSL hydrolase family protein n=1 Tax=Legionella sp. CNM-4043-24 TaxID=3421646 RepID=UPI00403AD310
MKLKTSLLSLLFSSAVAASPINTIAVFGDSLSDNGNLYEYMQHRVPQSPPYFEGHFSNGPVWIERLADLMFPQNGSRHLLDYAFGGAGVSMDVDEDVLFSLHHEVDVYALSHENKADPNTLFVVWIGANNYLAMPEDDEASVRDVIGGTRIELQRLLDMGARHILVLNLPDLGKTPAARDFDSVERLTALSLNHNAALADLIQDMKERTPGVQWFQYDVFTSFDGIFSTPEKFGLSNTQDTCYDVSLDEPSKTMLVKMAAKRGQRNLDDACQGYLFFDPVHVTTVTHDVVAHQVHDLLKAGGLEPAE